MAERRKFTVRDWIIGVVCLGLSFIVIFSGADALVPDWPSWVIAAIAAAVGVVLAYAFIGSDRSGRGDKP